MSDAKRSWFSSLLPALTLMVMAPALAELLPGATRLSSAIVFPIEMVIWGGGAVMARELARRFRLGWFGLVCLALALAVAEEFLIQQTSVAPLVIKLKGVEYARSFGVNTVYFVWALLYEALFVVLIPVAMTEMIFPSRRTDGWLSWVGWVILCLLWVPACYAAWYGWNQVARVSVFHLPPYNITTPYVLAGATMIAVLFVLAFTVGRALTPKPITPPHPVVLFVLAALAAAVVFALCILSFGIAPAFPPLAAMAIGVVLGLVMMAVVPGWMASPRWSAGHDVAATYGAVLSNFGVMFIAFIGATPLDLYGKMVLDGIGVVLMLWIATVYLGRGKSAKLDA